MDSADASRAVAVATKVNEVPVVRVRGRAPAKQLAPKARPVVVRSVRRVARAAQDAGAIAVAVAATGAISMVARSREAAVVHRVTEFALANPTGWRAFEAFAFAGAFFLPASSVFVSNVFSPNRLVWPISLFMAANRSPVPLFLRETKTRCCRSSAPRC